LQLAQLEQRVERREAIEVQGRDAFLDRAAPEQPELDRRAALGGGGPGQDAPRQALAQINGAAAASRNPTALCQP
jgi:hypothetical protein